MPMKRYRERRVMSISVKDIQAMERQGWQLIHVSRDGQKLIITYRSRDLASEVLGGLAGELVDEQESSDGRATRMGACQ